MFIVYPTDSYQEKCPAGTIQCVFKLLREAVLKFGTLILFQNNAMRQNRWAKFCQQKVEEFQPNGPGIICGCAAFHYLAADTLTKCRIESAAPHGGADKTRHGGRQGDPGTVPDDGAIKVVYGTVV
jgi:hypothetical protein